MLFEKFKTLKKEKCEVCDVLKKQIDYQQRMIDRLLVERGLPPIKDKNVKPLSENEITPEDIIRPGVETYGE